MLKRMLLLLGILLIVMPVSAQSETGELVLKLRRDFGYGGFKNDIQGLFTINVQDEEQLDLAKVVFYIDEDVLYEDTEAPFKYQFNTDTFSLGKHVLSAVGIMKDGREIESNQLVREFVPASEGANTAGKIIGPILGFILIASLFSFLVTLPNKGKKDTYQPGEMQNYGLLGGAVCPHCQRPFGRHIWGLNIVVGKLDRCPYCGKWSIARRASPAELFAADRAQLEKSRTEVGKSVNKDEKLRKDLDDSRFTDL